MDLCCPNCSLVKVLRTSILTSGEDNLLKHYAFSKYYVKTVNIDVNIEKLYEKLRQYPEIMKTSPHKNTGDLFYLNRIQKLNQSCSCGVFPLPREETRNYVVLYIM